MKERDIRKILLLTISLTTGLVISGNALAEQNSWFGGFKSKIYKIMGHKQKGLRGRVDALEAQVTNVEAQVGAIEAQVDGSTQAIEGKQERVTVICPPGQALVLINADGSGECAGAGSGGGLPPAESVDSSTIIDGSIMPEDLAVRRHVMAVPAEAFVDIRGGSVIGSYSMGGAYLTSPGSGTMVAPVNLPHGARVTEVAVWVLDNASADFEIDFARRGHIAAPAEFLVELESMGMNQNVTSLSSGDISIDVDNLTGNYHVRAFANWPGNNSLRIYGARISYEH